MLTASNSYAGGTTVSAGTLEVAGTASLPGFATAGKLAVASGGMVAVGAGGSGWTAANIASLVSSNGSGFAAGSGLGIDTTAGNFSYASNIAGSMGLAKLGSNSLVLTGSDAYSGGTTVAAGTLQVGNAAALGSGGLAVNGGLVDLDGNSITVASLSGSGGAISDLSAGARATLLSLNQSGATTFAGAVLDGPHTPLGFSKSGTGAILMTGSNSYSGSTTVNQGGLVVNGSLASPVVVNSGGTLGGTGTLSSVTVSPSGAIAPGDPLGTMTITGSLSLAQGATMDYELDTPGTGDLILAGNLALNGQQFSDFNFTWTNNFGPGAYDLIESGSVPSGSLGTNVSGAIDGLPASIAVQGNDLVLTVSSVPEPGTLVLLAVAVSVLGTGLRRQKKPRVAAPLTVVEDAPATLAFPARGTEAHRRAA